MPWTILGAQVDVEDKSAAALAMIRGMLYSAGYMRTSNIPLSFYDMLASDGVARATNDTHAEERDKLVPLQESSLWIGILSPNLFEVTHFLACDGFRSARHLEDIVEALDDHT